MANFAFSFRLDASVEESKDARLKAGATQNATLFTPRIHFDCCAEYEALIDSAHQ